MLYILLLSFLEEIYQRNNINKIAATRTLNKHVNKNLHLSHHMSHDVFVGAISINILKYNIADNSVESKSRHC